MTIAEIRQIEEKRNDSHNTVHLIREGDWYRAHDWSAWLLSIFQTTAALEKPLKMMAKQLKDGYIDAFCGFPCSSMNKYLPGDGSIEFIPVNDNQIDVILKKIEIEETTIEQMRLKVDEWKLSLPMQESKRQRRDEHELQEQAPRIIRFTDIMANILSLPLEDMSPRDAYEYLRELRKQVASMF